MDSDSGRRLTGRRTVLKAAGQETRGVKLAVSTLGMPGQSLAEAAEIAAGGGCAGLELRLHPDTGVHLAMTAGERTAALALITARGLKVLGLAGYARVAAPGPDAPVVRELAAGLRLAHAFSVAGADGQTPALRVFPGGTDSSAAARRIRAALRETPGTARVLVETHDSMPAGVDVARLLDTVGLPGRTGAIWDLLHPWRHGEPPGQTLAALGDWLGYVQAKDAVSASDTTPVPLGAGSVPLAETAAALRARGYDGWICLEWERTWYPQVQPVVGILPGARDWLRGL